LRNETVDALRAIAALSVCFFHFTSGGHYTDVSVLHPITRYGWVGVDVFFVISGFIIPLAMDRAGYTLSTWPRFMAKRLIRLEPPYLTSIVIVLLLGLASVAMPGFRGTQPDWSVTQVAAHLGYVNAFVGLPWLNPVYWSLAIEFQFYLLVGLVFPLLRSGTYAVRLVLIATMAISPWIATVESYWLITSYLPIFAAGILTFLYVSHISSRSDFCVMLGCLGVLIAWQSGVTAAIASVTTAILIATVRLPRIPIVAWFGAISYSLYLLHAPVGGRIVNLSARFAPSSTLEIVVVAIALAISVAAAYVLYRFVEKPSVALAASISYRRLLTVRTPDPSGIRS